MIANIDWVVYIGLRSLGPNGTVLTMHGHAQDTMAFNLYVNKASMNIVWSTGPMTNGVEHSRLPLSLSLSVFISMGPNGLMKKSI